MQNLLSACVLLLIMACANLETEKQIVELSCGQCQFGLTSQKGCDLAVRIDGESYFVDGADIDEFGDAHDEEIGFCEVVRMAEVEGEVIDDRFIVKYVKMLDE